MTIRRSALSAVQSKNWPNSPFKNATYCERTGFGLRMYLVDYLAAPFTDRARINMHKAFAGVGAHSANLQLLSAFR